MNVKVLSKAFGLLEYLAMHPGRVVTQHEILQNMSGLSQPTCVRLLADFLEAGYIEKVDARGYQLGPLSYFLGHGHRFNEALLQAAQPRLEEYSHKTGQSILICARHLDFRVIFGCVNHANGIQIDAGRARYNDMTLTSTGRLLLSQMNEEEIESFIERHGVPTGSPWPEKQTHSQFLSRLEKIRRQGEVVSSHHGRISGAVLLEKMPSPYGGRIVLGSVWREAEGDQTEAFMSEMHRTAEEIVQEYCQSNEKVIC